MTKRRQTPTVRLRRLASELKKLRTSADMTRDEVADRTGVNGATLYRIETARVRPQRRTLVALLDLYGISVDQRDEILALSREADVQGWLRPYHSELPEQYTTYISFEDEAASVSNYESLFVPGLLQTEDYALAVVRGVLPSASAKEVEQRVQARMERQQVLAKADPLHLWAITDEAALRRDVGGRSVMRSQMKHLAAAAQEPNVTFQVIPFAAGAHPGMPGSFVLMGFRNTTDPEVVYIDSMAGDLFLEAEADIKRYSAVFDNLRAVAEGPDRTLQLLSTLAAE
ncbi:helix-turn-helix domain-containing protein [Streptomyces europaeiscabiei]|uniref:helix-turn-helix domain-containing protein n=1 Tax=Streptomyces europaeiscabiei TaxID=146819 RepID=UPI00062844E5|nr:helix-turn-helix transcriptional regulator [Streptomyces europaeiscabiei]